MAEEVVVSVEEEEVVVDEFETSGELVVPVEEEELVAEEFGISADLVVPVEEEALVAEEFGISADLVVPVEKEHEASVAPFGDFSGGSEPTSTFSNLKSKLHPPEVQQTSPSSSSSKLCPKFPDVKHSQGCHAPKLISFGPYHHRHPRLKNGERMKVQLAHAYIKAFELNLDEIYRIISGLSENLKAFYDEETVRRYEDGEFTEMMVVDGCALLWYILSCVGVGVDHEDYNIRYKDRSLVYQDALLLENQLPYLLLDKLTKMVQPSEPYFWTVTFQEFFVIDQKPKKENEPCHLLDMYRTAFLGYELSNTRSVGNGSSETPSVKKLCMLSAGYAKEQFMASRNVTDLRAAGIRIKSSPTRCLRDISFTSYGILSFLRLPPITIDKSTKSLFLNLIAYEISSDLPLEFISYLCFLDSLIAHAGDVNELQSAGVLHNNLGTHEDVAQFFNAVSANLKSDFHAYKDVRVKIRQHLKSHCNSKMKMCFTLFLNTYFSSRWAIIGLIGAAFALFLSAVNAYYSAFPPYGRGQA